MKRDIPDSNQFNLLRMLDDYARTEGIALHEDATRVKFIKQMDDVVKGHLNDPKLVHGFRIESMFAHMVAALGGARLLTEEDSGAFFYLQKKKIRRPDFRIITNNDKQFLIEVKNFHQKNPKKPYKIKREYLESLQRYAETCDLPLKIAIYWSRWKIWTLTDSHSFEEDRSNFKISLENAMIRNEMIELGDQMIGTPPPLSFRVYADSQQPQTIDKDGKAFFTIKKLSFFANNLEIVDEIEQKLAWFFWLHGNWDNFDETVKVVDNKLKYIDYAISPIDWIHEQGFAFLGSLSEMISARYNHFTSPEGRIDALLPNHQPEQLRVLIPPNYSGSVLKLWRFYIQPNFDDIEKS